MIYIKASTFLTKNSDDGSYSLNDDFIVKFYLHSRIHLCTAICLINDLTDIDDKERASVLNDLSTVLQKKQRIEVKNKRAKRSMRQSK